MADREHPAHSHTQTHVHARQAPQGVGNSSRCQINRRSLSTLLLHSSSTALLPQTESHAGHSHPPPPGNSLPFSLPGSPDCWVSGSRRRCHGVSLSGCGHKVPARQRHWAAYQDVRCGDSTQGGHTGCQVRPVSQGDAARPRVFAGAAVGQDLSKPNR